MTPNQIVVKVGQHAVGGAGETLITLGLGSCVAILLHDPVARVGGMAHVLLPDPSLSRNAANPAKFATTAVPYLVQEMNVLGGRTERMQARLVGGASMFAALLVAGTMNMGERNIHAARATLRTTNIPVVGESVGGDYGRSVRFHVLDGRTLVTSLSRGDVTL